MAEKDFRTHHNGRKRGRKRDPINDEMAQFPCRTCGAVPDQSCIPAKEFDVRPWIPPHADRRRQYEAAQIAAIRR